MPAGAGRGGAWKGRWYTSGAHADEARAGVDGRDGPDGRGAVRARGRGAWARGGRDGARVRARGDGEDG